MARGTGKGPKPESLGDALVVRDAERFVGRKPELADLDDLLEPHPTAPIVFLHGPPGIGKSALAREFARRAVAGGWVVQGFGGATIDEAGWRAQVVDQMVGTKSVVLVVDPMPTASTAAGRLREQVLRALPAETRVLIVSRKPPDRGWSEQGWDALVRPFELGPLEPSDARKLVGGLEIEAENVDKLLRWGEGEPLALVLGAAHLRRHAAPVLDEDPRLARAMLERLLGDETASIDEVVLRVAASVPFVDRQLLADLIPDVDPADALHRLGELTVAQRSGGRVSLHNRTRRVLADLFWHRDPAGDRDLRRRTADHAHDRVASGDGSWLPVFADLFREPGLRWAFAADARRRHRTDRPRSDDASAAAESLGAVGTTWWAGVQRWFEEAPGTVTVVRDRNDELSGFCVMMTPVSAPDWAVEDPIMAPRLEHAAERYPAGDVVLWRDAFGFPADEIEDPAGPTIIAIHGAINRSGRIDALCTYGTVVSGDPMAQELATAYSAIPIPELAVADGERTVECHVLHHGFGGFAGGARALVYREIGLTPPPPDLESVRSAVRTALRKFHDPVALATNPLASGSSTHERSESVRAMLIGAIEHGFGDTAEQRIVAAVVERGYLQPDGTHEAAARELHLGRSTYFRHLAAGVDRITVLIDERLRAVDAGP